VCTDFYVVHPMKMMLGGRLVEAAPVAAARAKLGMAAAALAMKARRSQSRRVRVSIRLPPVGSVWFQSRMAVISDV